MQCPVHHLDQAPRGESNDAEVNLLCQVQCMPIFRSYSYVMFHVGHNVVALVEHCKNKSEKVFPLTATALQDSKRYKKSCGGELERELTLTTFRPTLLQTKS
jgi:hypothetical protein